MQSFHGYLGILAGLDHVLALAGEEEEAVKDVLLDSSLHILVEGCPIHSDRECWKRTCGRGRGLWICYGLVLSERRQEDR